MAICYHLRFFALCAVIFLHVYAQQLWPQRRFFITCDICFDHIEKVNISSTEKLIYASCQKVKDSETTLILWNVENPNQRGKEPFILIQ